MDQLNLAILPQITYRAEGFVVHTGVRAVIDEITALGRQPVFASAFVSAPARFGKTHCAIRVASDANQNGLYSRIIQGQEFGAFIEHRFEPRPDELIVVDDAQRYFAELQPGQSGPFVRWMETLRAGSGKIVFFSDRAHTSFSFDEHVRSRIAAGSGIEIGAPAEEDLSEVIDAMARQHGIKLTDRKTEFLEKRLRRDIPSIEEFIDKVVHLAFVLGRPVGFDLLGDAL